MSKLAASQTLYSVLGVNRHADNTQIRQAYRHLALATHPDKGGSAGEFLKVVEAFEVLSDAQKRATYDEDLQRTGSQDGRGIQAAADRRRGAHTHGLYDMQPKNEYTLNRSLAVLLHSQQGAQRQRPRRPKQMLLGCRTWAARKQCFGLRATKTKLHLGFAEVKPIRTRSLVKAGAPQRRQSERRPCG